jgi:hypothetical protein
MHKRNAPSFWQSRALYVAARLNIATVLGDETIAATDIAAGREQPGLKTHQQYSSIHLAFWFRL